MNAAAADLTVAETILSQLGGPSRLAAMCGCKDFVGDAKSVYFKVGTNAKKITACSVLLDLDDTYTVIFYVGHGLKLREASAHPGVYCDMLRPLFESQTGMYLSL